MVGGHSGWKLFAIVSAVHAWVHFGPVKKILIQCNNRSVVDIWDLSHTQYGFSMATVFCAVYHNLNVCVVHVPSVCNDFADDLSCFQMDRFGKLASKPTHHQTTSLHRQ